MSANREESVSSAKNTGYLLAFIASACSLVIVYAASSAPIPLYAGYSRTVGLTSGDLSMTAVAYFAGTVVALLVFARLSNYLGRKPVSLITLGTTALGCLVFLHINGAPFLFIGRLLQGLSCGLASSAVAAYAMDSAPPSPTWLGASVVSGAPMVGLALGAFASGGLDQYTAGSPTRIFAVLLVLLALCAFAFLFSSETVLYRKGALRSLTPTVHIPLSVKKHLPAATCTFIGTWAIGGMYQAFSSSMASEQLGSTNTILGAAVFASLMAPNLFGSFLAGRFSPRHAQRAGMLVFLLCIAGAVYALHAGAAIPFFAASIVAGVAWGAAFSGAMRTLLQDITQESRAGVLSAVFLISYGGAAIPNLVVGRIAGAFSLSELTVGYLVLVAFMCALTFALSPRVR